MTNVVVITGRLCADPESRQTQSGTAVCHFRLAVGRNRKVEGKPEADFISCVCWGKTAEFAVKYLHRGGMITAEGRLQNADYVYLNEWTIYTIEDISGAHVDPYHYEINFLPEMIQPITFTSSD